MHVARQSCLVTIITVLCIVSSVVTPSLMAEDIAPVEQLGSINTIAKIPLPNPPNTGAWDYQSKYFIQNVYKSIQRDDYVSAKAIIEKILINHSFDSEVLPIAPLS